VLTCNCAILLLGLLTPAVTVGGLASSCEAVTPLLAVKPAHNTISACEYDLVFTIAAEATAVLFSASSKLF